jgi:prepilin-type N-terminal cleavage/methylation domain-containing protein
MGARRVLDDEAGFSLPEVLITIAIVGIAFAAILGGMLTSIVVSDVHRKEATSDALARSAAERLKDQGVAYVSCAGLNAYDSALPTAPSYTVSVTSLEVWNGNLTAGAAPEPVFAQSGPGCPDQGVQRITIVASATDGRATETVQILKRQGT